MKKALSYLAQWTWGVIQNLLGLVLFLFLARRNHRVFHGAVITTWKLGSSCSLGMFIFTARPYDSFTLKHEYGHTIQSLILGPLWLFVIGLPSLIWCGCFAKYREKHKVSYYSFYTEAWANKLGEKYKWTN